MAQDKNVQVKVSRSGGVQGPAGEKSFAPLVDVYETDEGTILVAELPGVAKDAVKIEVDKGVLTLSGLTSWEEPDEKYARTYVGFEGGEFFRAFALSDEVDRDRIDAVFGNGVLTLKLPKAEAAKTRKIEVREE